MWKSRIPIIWAQPLIHAEIVWFDIPEFHERTKKGWRLIYLYFVAWTITTNHVNRPHSKTDITQWTMLRKSSLTLRSQAPLDLNHRHQSSQCLNKSRLAHQTTSDLPLSLVWCPWRIRTLDYRIPSLSLLKTLKVGSVSTVEQDVGNT